MRIGKLTGIEDRRKGVPRGKAEKGGCRQQLRQCGPVTWPPLPPMRSRRRLGRRGLRHGHRSEEPARIMEEGQAETSCPEILFLGWELILFGSNVFVKTYSRKTPN